MKKFVFVCVIAFGPAFIMPLVTMDKYFALRENYKQEVERNENIIDKCQEVADLAEECLIVVEHFANSCVCSNPTKKERTL